MRSRPERLARLLPGHADERQRLMRGVWSHASVVTFDWDGFEACTVFSLNTWEVKFAGTQYFERAHRVEIPHMRVIRITERSTLHLALRQVRWSCIRTSLDHAIEPASALMTWASSSRSPRSPNRYMAITGLGTLSTNGCRPYVCAVLVLTVPLATCCAISNRFFGADRAYSLVDILEVGVLKKIIRCRNLGVQR